MLTTPLDDLQAASRRLKRALSAAYLRWRIAEAEKDAAVIQAESMTAPNRLIVIRSWITDAQAQLRALEAQP